MADDTSRIGGTRHFSDVSRCQQAPSSDCSRQQTYVSGSARRCCRDFYADFAVPDEHPAGGLPALLLHHIQRVASRGCRDFRQFEELAGCFFQPAILCSTHHEALSVADFIMQVMPDIRFPVTDSNYPFLYLPSRSAIRSEACCQR